MQGNEINVIEFNKKGYSFNELYNFVENNFRFDCRYTAGIAYEPITSSRVLKFFAKRFQTNENNIFIFYESNETNNQHNLVVINLEKSSFDELTKLYKNKVFL